MKTFRAFLLACVASGSIASHSAGATISGDAAFNQRLLVPIFVADVRKLIVDSAQSHGWKLIDERPGELTFELQHARSHMDVVAKAYYSRSELSFRKVSVRTFQCDGQAPCEIIPDVVTRWMIGLRREVGAAFLRLAIRDAGGNVSPEPAAPAEAE
jgi:hypothetical protein